MDDFFINSTRPFFQGLPEEKVQVDSQSRDRDRERLTPHAPHRDIRDSRDSGQILREPTEGLAQQISAMYFKPRPPLVQSPLDLSVKTIRQSADSSTERHIPHHPHPSTNSPQPHSSSGPPPPQPPQRNISVPPTGAGTPVPQGVSSGGLPPGHVSGNSGGLPPPQAHPHPSPTSAPLPLAHSSSNSGQPNSGHPGGHGSTAPTGGGLPQVQVNVANGGGQSASAGQQQGQSQSQGQSRPAQPQGQTQPGATPTPPTGPPHQHYFPVNFYNYNSSYYSGYPTGYGNYPPPPWYYQPPQPPPHMTPPQPQPQATHMAQGSQPQPQHIPTAHHAQHQQPQHQSRPNQATPHHQPPPQPQPHTAATPHHQPHSATPHHQPHSATPHQQAPPQPHSATQHLQHSATPQQQAPPHHLGTTSHPQSQSQLHLAPPHMNSSTNHSQAPPHVLANQGHAPPTATPTRGQFHPSSYPTHGGLTNHTSLPFNSVVGRSSVQTTPNPNPNQRMRMGYEPRPRQSTPNMGGVQSHGSTPGGPTSSHPYPFSMPHPSHYATPSHPRFPPPLNHHMGSASPSPAMAMAMGPNQKGGGGAYGNPVPPPPMSNQNVGGVGVSVGKGTSPKKPSRKSLLNLLRNSLESRMLKNDTTKDKFQFNHQTWNFHRKSGELTSPRIKTKAEKKQLFPNLLSGQNQSQGQSQSAQSQGTPSVFDFREEEVEEKHLPLPLPVVHTVPVFPPSPPKKKGGSKKFTHPRFAPGLPPIPLALPPDTPFPLKDPPVVVPPPVVIPPVAVAVAPPLDDFFATCDSFLEDLTAHPNQVKSKRGLKKKKRSAGVGVGGSGGRVKKNESEVDSDFELEEKEKKEKREESSEEEEEEEETKSEEEEETKSEEEETKSEEEERVRKERKVQSPRRPLRISSEDESGSESEEETSDSEATSTEDDSEDFKRKLRPKRVCRGARSSSTSNSGSSGEEWRGARSARSVPRKRRRIRFGDGSDFKRPGLEEELMDFKRKLRMPSKLISVRGNQKRESRESREERRETRRSTRANDRRERRDLKRKGVAGSGRREKTPERRGKSPIIDKKGKEKESKKPSPEKKKEEKPSPFAEKKKAPTPIPEKKPVPVAVASKVTPPTPLLPTPGVSKFNAKMSIKSVFGVEAPPPAAQTQKKTLRRNKFKSGFDYIRKKSKKKEASETGKGTKSAVEKQLSVSLTPKNLTPTDIQAEIRGWVLNKGLGETTLHRAARLGYKDVATYSLENNVCPPNCKDNAGYSPLHECCVKGHLEVAKVLLEYGANVSQAAPGGMRPLHEACENGHVELCRLLIAYGADPLLATYSGQSPLELAENHPAVKALLLQHISDVEGKTETPWDFRNWEDSFDSGFDVMSGCPSPSRDDTLGFEFEASDGPLPPLYTLKESTQPYVLLQDVLNYLSITKERFLKQNPVETIELNSNDFLEEAHCCHLLGEKFNLNNSSEFLTLIKYDERIKKMFNIEQCFIK